MILAATETAQTALERPLLLLLDDPAAELDGDSLARLMAAVAGWGARWSRRAWSQERSIPRPGAQCSTWNTAHCRSRLATRYIRTRKTAKIP